jgi:branched-subunit amino acid ABC-type transport system permease component
MIDTQKVLTIVIEAASFIAALASIAAGIIMANVTKKFGTGILASGFKVISIGVFFIAVAIVVDAVESYLEVVSPTVTSLNLILTGYQSSTFPYRHLLNCYRKQKNRR